MSLAENQPVSVETDNEGQAALKRGLEHRSEAIRAVDRTRETLGKVAVVDQHGNILTKSDLAEIERGNTAYKE